MTDPMTLPDTLAALKPCPFCGCENVYPVSPSLGHSSWRVFCDDCHANGPSIPSYNSDEAEARCQWVWNIRYPVSADRIEALEAEIKKRDSMVLHMGANTAEMANQYRDRIEALEAENERLREALAQIRDRKWNTMTQGCDAACEAAQIARAALGEKK